ncbi:MAG: HAD family hydrolase [Opitutaceae bacterium]|nr:HAD family hydrolase [Opitutaceae bacterium]
MPRAPLRFRTVLFDLDGTLIDHLAAIHRSYCHTLPQLGYPAPTRAQVRRAVGGGLERAMLRFVTEAELPRALAIFRSYWSRTMLDDAELMPGAGELLRALHAAGCTLAVLTNKHGPSSRAVCQHLGIAPYLHGIFGAQDTPWLKPDPAFVSHVLTSLNAQSATTCLVGDSPFDYEAGRQGGLACYLVATGTHSAEELRAAGAGHIFPNLTALARDVFGLDIPAAR